MPPGNYTLTVTAPGFRTFKQVGIDLAVGRLPTLDVKLEVGAVAETVEVSGSATMVDTIPEQGRRDRAARSPGQPSQGALLPNAYSPRPRSARAKPSKAAAPRGSAASSGTGYQIDGASDGENVFLVDGVNITHIQNGGVGKSYQMEFIDEVQVKTSSFEAEFGGALGGVINVVPKKGSNEWHGSLLTYLSSNAFNANNTDRSLTTNPTLPSLNTTTRLDSVPEYFMANKDQLVTVEPGLPGGRPAVEEQALDLQQLHPQHQYAAPADHFHGRKPGPAQSDPNHNHAQRLQPAGLRRN